MREWDPNFPEGMYAGSAELWYKITTYDINDSMIFVQHEKNGCVEFNFSHESIRARD